VSKDGPSVGVFIAFLIAGAVGAAVGIMRPVDNPEPLQLTARQVIDGTPGQRVEDRLEANLPLRDFAVTAAATFRYLAVREGEPGVVVGRDGWLYTREEFERHSGDQHELSLRLTYMIDVAVALEARGVGLVIALIPSKARVVPDPLPDRLARLADHPRYETALGRLREHGLAAPDLRPALSSIPAAFLRTDTHWTPEGARVAALEIAAAARSAGAEPAAGVRFATTRAGTLEVTGDLMSFLTLGPLAPAFGYPPESVRHFETSMTGRPALGLFDTPSIPVSLVGTSYSADPRWNFSGALMQSLNLDVLDISSEAVGPFAPMADYLGGPAFAEVKPDFVVWEVPERYLTLPDVAVPDAPVSGAQE
jgi:alginate O-acetyltransferase complex protein AlgJ